MAEQVDRERCIKAVKGTNFLLRHGTGNLVVWKGELEQPRTPAAASVGRSRSNRRTNPRWEPSSKIQLHDNRQSANPSVRDENKMVVGYPLLLCLL